MKKTIIRIVIFLILLLSVLGCVNKVLKVKYGDGIYSMTKFYELEDNSVDVLVLGSSHAFEDINTGILWDNYGMASYVLGGSAQRLWNTYYYLKEALKTQTPEIIVLEVAMINSVGDYSDDSVIVKNTYGLHWSLDKFKAIMVSAPKERWAELALEYRQYHTRYSELSSADFLPNQNNSLYDDWKGFGCNMATTSLEAIDVSGVTELMPIYDKCEKYYRMIIELAKEYDIPIVVTVSPYAGIDENDQMKFNTAAQIATEYNVDFVNFNLYLDEMGLDYSTDAADTGHLNYKGSQKYTAYLGEYLTNNYTISNRKDDEKYISWERNAEYISRMIENQILKESYDLLDIIDRIQDTNYWVMISLDGDCDSSDIYISAILYHLGIYDENAIGIWLIENNSVVWKSGDEDAEKYIMSSNHDFLLRHVYNDDDVDDQFWENYLIIDNINYKSVGNGLNIVVYDTVTRSVVTNIGIDSDNNYSLGRYN